MNILIISSSNPYVVAGKVALFIKHDLESRGHEVKLLTKFYDSQYENGIISYNGKLMTNIKAIKRKINNRLKKYLPTIITKVPRYAVQTYFQFIPFLRTNKILRLTGFMPDVIIVFFMQKFLNYIDLYRLQEATKVPIFILTPDMAPFTGLCHYAYDCERYIDNCGNCPAILSSIQKDLSWFNYSSKIKNAQKMDVIGVYWADIIGEKIKQSKIFRNKPIEKVKIPLELERTYYKPEINEVEKLRSEIGLSMNDFVISVCSVALFAERKGIKDIIQAINYLDKKGNKKRIVLVVAGKGNLPAKSNVRTINLGLLPKDELANLFKISDIFISASYEDVGPETILLSLACGVPVISYKTGIAEELIIENNNGFLLDVRDIKGISDRIIEFMNLNDLEVKRYKDNCVKTAEDFYNPDTVNSLESIILKYVNHNILNSEID